MSMSPNVSVVLTSGDGSSFASALRERLESMGAGASEVRCSTVVDSLDGLTDVSVVLIAGRGLCQGQERKRLTQDPLIIDK